MNCFPQQSHQLQQAQASQPPVPITSGQSNQQPSQSGPFGQLPDHPLSICLSFLPMHHRYLNSNRVSRQWNRVVAFPSTNVHMVVDLRKPLYGEKTPSTTLMKWASAQAGSELPPVPSVPFGQGTAHPYGSSSLNCAMAVHLGGQACHGNVQLPRPFVPGAQRPNPLCLSEHLGWPNLDAAARTSRHGSVHAQRLNSYEGWSRMVPSKVQTLTLQSPYEELHSIGDPIVFGKADEEWTELLKYAAADAARTASDALEQGSPFPRLTRLKIAGPALSWPKVQSLIRACPTVIHLTVDNDASEECAATCAIISARGPHATVNGVKCSESRCNSCGERVSPLLTCEACSGTACGPCLLRSPDRNHFLCHSGNHHDGGILYCYSIGQCDDHVGFQCPDCISDGAGDTSPGECGACGALACYEHCAYGSCDHYPEVMWRCSKCRCFKCSYCCGEFSGDGEGGSDEEEDEQEEEEEEDDDDDRGESRGGKPKAKKQRPRWRHG